MGPLPALPVVDLAPGTLFIGDLHLDAAAPEVLAGVPFLDWLLTLSAQACPRLVILGDLFDSWVGPATARLPGATPVVSALAQAVSRGIAIDVVHGNRDFLLGTLFGARTGAALYPRGFVGRLQAADDDAARVLCVHGDELCTLDRPYQRLKRVVRSRPALWLAPRLPDPAVLWLGRRLRRASRQAIELKPDGQKAQQEAAVLDLARFHRCRALVCGHAHRFRDETVEGVRWLVLDAFGGARDAIRAVPGGLEAAATGLATL